MRAYLSRLVIFAIFLQATSCTWICMGFELNKEYITTQLCINRFTPAVTCSGFCYIDKQVEKERKQQDSNTKAKQIELIVYLPLTSFLVKTPDDVPDIRKTCLFFNRYLLLAGAERYLFKPPILFFV
ncbi:hypothetical protein [Sphingobacterium faecium]|uniref:hypothetical protein n=1 Tax=Sphingobacterium faecium TaxID=34087 RepID=UPI003207B3DD